MSASGLAAHLSPAELGQRYRAARCPVERSHLQIVWLLSLGRSEREVAQVTGYGRRWVGEVARRYDEDGPGGLGDRRRGNAGAKPLLGAEGEAVWFVCSTVDAELLSAGLAAFAAAVGAGEGKLMVLVLDDAGWHVSGDLVVPKGIELAFLPSYTPALQPAEHLWPLADEAVANKHFATLKDLDVALSERCRTLAGMPETIK